MTVQISHESLAKVKELTLSIVMEHMDRKISSFDQINSNMLMGFGFLLDRFRPDESKSAIERILLRRGELIEDEIKEETESYGWYYAELSPNANRKIMSLLKIGYEFTGSDSEQLYDSLEDYIERFKQNGFVFDNLWDVCYYLDILLNLLDNKNQVGRYDEQIQDCVSLLAEALKTAQISRQLKSYIIWLLHRASKNKIVKSRFTTNVSYLLDEVSDSPLETGLWILFVCLDMEVLTPKIETVLESLISRLKKDDLWKESTKSAFLAFTSSVLRRTDSWLKIPYATFSIRETAFFGIVAETLLKAVSDLEKEKKTLDFDENSLRNRFLAVLKVRFGGLASAETFRCLGLTDIIVTNPEDHYEEVVIECKIWRGKKYYQKGIEQAINYLTKAENRVIILVFFKGSEGFFTLKTKLVEAIESDERYIKNSLSEGIANRSISSPVEKYLFSWHKRKDQGKVGIHHIFGSSNI